LKRSNLFFLLLVSLLVLCSIPGFQSAAYAHSPLAHHVPFLHTRQYDAKYTQNGANLLYANGPIMPGAVKVYVVFWEPGGSYTSTGYNQLILRYFNDIGFSGLYRNNMQYIDSSGEAPRGSLLAGSWVDSAPYPSQKLSDVQARQEISRAMGINGWSASISHLFFVFTAKDETICAGTGCGFTDFCAYHSHFAGPVIYAIVPYAATNLAACGVPESPNGDIDAESTISVASHEQMESVTDPLQNAWLDRSGDEIGDKCMWNFGGVMTVRGHPYLVQEEWDNARSSCVLAGP